MITILEIAQITSAPFIIGIIHFSLKAIGNKSSIDSRFLDTKEKQKEYIEYKKNSSYLSICFLIVVAIAIVGYLIQQAE